MSGSHITEKSRLLSLEQVLPCIPVYAHARLYGPLENYVRVPCRTRKFTFGDFKKACSTPARQSCVQHGKNCDMCTHSRSARLPNCAWHGVYLNGSNGRNSLLTGISSKRSRAILSRATKPRISVFARHSQIIVEGCLF